MKIPFEEPLSVGHEVIKLRPDIVAALLITIRTGWQHGSFSADVHTGTGEVKITERLRDGMRRALKELPWGKGVLVAPGTESRSRPEVLLPDGRTDIPVYLIAIFLRLQEHDPHVIIECKRIAGNNSDLCREYVVEGIDRFCIGKYGGRHTVGLMVGYLVEKDEGAAVAGINAYLSKKHREPEHLGPSSLALGSLAWRSLHPRPALAQPIELSHSFFSLKPAPP